MEYKLWDGENNQLYDVRNMGRYSLTKIRNISANARNKSRYLEKSTEAWREGRWIIEITGPYRVSWDGTVQSVKGTQIKRKSANEKNENNDQQ